MAKHPLYAAWSGMVNRCHNPNNSSYHQYGGRGVVVCDRWRYGEGGVSGFRCWLGDMGERPEGMTLDRIDSTGPYSPQNCRWATAAEQRMNLSAAGKERQRAGASAAAKLKWEAFRASGLSRRNTHCPQGHEYGPGQRCRECGRIKAAEKRRAAGIPARNLKRNRPDFQERAANAIGRA